MPVLGERARLASARREGAPCKGWWRGRALPVLVERARLAITGERARLAITGERVRLAITGERARLEIAAGEGAPCQCWGRGRALPVLWEARA